MGLLIDIHMVMDIWDMGRCDIQTITPTMAIQLLDIPHHTNSMVQVQT